jgi:serine/threonine protein kinase/tetratricopeptide (TPR) repeat protein
MPTDLPLGPFDLIEPIASGGMGTVWRAIHRRQGVAVAVKVIRPEKAPSARVIDRFRDEVRAVASMNHRNIVTVLDYGTVAAETAANSDGAITAGTPWLAMELCSGGTLKNSRPEGWSELADLLDSVLSALAFSHAKGILHRDLKPENILVAGPDDLRPGVKLADYGLAFIANESEEDGKTAAGTLRYMAPEQMRGAWRDFGPWTDLYAFGGLAWWLTSGQTPFQNVTTVTNLIRAHVYQAPPTLEPAFAVPAALDSWLRWLLAKKPHKRPLLAADALRELRSFRDEPLVRPSVFSQPSQPHGDADDETIVLKSVDVLIPTTVDQTLVTEITAADEDRRAIDGAHRPLHTGDLPGWQLRRGGDPVAYPLVGAGLGLFGLRSVPLVGRTAQRDVLWECLLHAVRTGSPQAVLLRGGPGAGKSRLAQWLSERAHEVGVAHTLHATHSPISGPDDGLVPMIAKAFNCQGLSGAARSARVASVMRNSRPADPVEVAAVDEFLGSSDDGQQVDELSQSSMFLATTEARYGVLRRLLVRQSEYRPAIIWLDDGQWGPDALELTLDLLRHREQINCRCLVVITVRDDLLGERPVESSLLEHLSERGATTCPVPPLDSDDRLELVQNLLGLEGDLAAQVEHRSDGNPLFAVQLVADWVQRGVLTVGATGFRLAEGARAVIPDSIHDLWAQKTDRFLAAEPESARGWLELAAVLGTSIDEREWLGAGERAGLTPISGLVGRLRRQGLGHRNDPTQWRLAHGLLAESLRRQADEGDRLGEHHWAAAQMLATKRGGRGVSARLAHHLIGAGRSIEALAPLIAAGRECKAEAGFAAGLELLEQMDRVVAQHAVAASDLRIGQATLLRLELFNLLERPRDALELAEPLVQACAEFGWSELQVPATRLLGKLLIRQGKAERGERLLREALAASESLSAPLETARCLAVLSAFLSHAGMSEEAKLHLMRCLPIFRESPTQETYAHHALMSMGMVALRHAIITRRQGSSARAGLIDAHRWVGRAIEEADRLQHSFLRAEAINLRALIERADGRLEQAATSLQQAIELRQSLSSNDAVLPFHMTLGLVQLDRKDFDAAYAEFSAGVERFEKLGRMGMAGAAQACLLACLTQGDRWDDFDATLETAERRLNEAKLFSEDIAQPVERAGDMARDARRRDQAGAAYRFALRQWIGLNDDDGVRRVERELAALAG